VACPFVKSVSGFEGLDHVARPEVSTLHYQGVPFAADELQAGPGDQESTPCIGSDAGHMAVIQFQVLAVPFEVRAARP
jgi:hypothetical protein